MARTFMLPSVGPTSLDFREHNRNRFCGRWSVVGKIEETGSPCWRYARLGCKRWTCARCGPKKVRRLRRAVIDRATERGLRRLLTLTLNPATCSPEDSVRYIRQCWNKFRTSLKRCHKGSITFIAVLELQKSGYAHLHILVDRYMAQHWISEAWQAVGGGQIVDIRLVDIHRIAAYLSKYLTKDFLMVTLRPYQRRYTTSRDIVLFIRPTPGTWTILRERLEALYWSAGGGLQEKREEDGALSWFTTNEAVES